MAQTKELLSRALARSRPGDILHMAGSIPAGSTDDLLAAARALRNLMAYPAAVEVLDRVLEAAPDCVKALEQKVVCLARLGPEYAVDANALLEKAMHLAGDGPGLGGEALALQGRLNKERWYRTWYAETPEPTPGDVAQSCGLAVESSFYLWAAIDKYVESFGRTGAYYDAVNAVSLLALAAYLQDACPDSQPRSKAAGERLWADVSARAGRAIESAAAGAAADDEDAYWAAASRLEWEIVSGAGDGDDLVARVEGLTDQVVRRAGTRRFLLDSTIHQFRIFRCLGFRPRAVRAALGCLETALRFTPDPSLPRHRVVFVEGNRGSDGRVEPGARRGGDPDAKKTVLGAIEELAKTRSDMEVLIVLRGADSVACAEACREIGAPYQALLPAGDEKYTSEMLSLLGKDGGERLAAAKRKAREVSAMHSCVGPCDPGRRDVEVLRWALACARAYGSENVALLLSADAAVETFEGTAVRPNAAGGAVCADGTPAAARTRGAAGAAPSAAAPSAAGTAAAPGHARAAPAADEEVEYFMDHCASDATRERWKAYDPSARALLMGLGITWEPFGLGAPVLLESNTIGFELLCEGPNGERFGKIMAQCRERKIEMLDMQLIILLRAMVDVPKARNLLRMALGLRADALLVSVNVDKEMLASQDFVEVVSRHRLHETTVFEVNEEVGPDVVARLREVADTYKLRLALDDSNNMDKAVRDALLDRVDLVKVDFKFTRQQLALIGKTAPEQIMAELVGLRQKDLPLVVEGIETEQDTAFIQNHWRKEHGPIYFQGWRVQVSGSLAPFFVPMNTKTLPKGYRFRGAG